MDETQRRVDEGTEQGSRKQEMREQGRAHTMPALMRMFVWVSVLCMALSWLVAVLVWRRGGLNGGGMWALEDDRFADLVHYDGIFPLLHTRAFFTGAERFAYPAPSAVVYDGILHLGPHRLGIYLAVTVLLAVLASVVFGRRLVREGLAPGQTVVFLGAALLGSWPLLFLLERANIELILIALTVLGSLCFWRGKMTAAALLWGLAASMKIYPAVLLILFLRNGRLRAFWLGLVTLCGTMLASWEFVGPTVAVAALGTLHGIGGFVGSYATHSREWELRHDHSFLAFIKEPLALHSMHLSMDVSRISLVYFAVVAIGVPMLYVRLFRRLPELNRYLLAMIAMVTLPPVSFDYTLVHLYFGFGLVVLLLLRSERTSTALPVLRPIFWCFALIFASENFVYYLGLRLNGMIKAAALFWMATLLFRHHLTLRDETTLHSSEASRDRVNAIG